MLAYLGWVSGLLYSDRMIRRVGILFSGGPAPAANAVIAAAASAFRRGGCQVIGIRQG
jgi:ATP-dependent phosphofructokinase / diphosphate-dependent phosphofructokinase